MRSWTFRILGCVVLGIVTTVAVAWACAAWSDTEELNTPKPSIVTLWSSHQWWVDAKTSIGIGRRHHEITLLLRRVTKDDVGADYISWEYRAGGGELVSSGLQKVIKLPKWSRLGVSSYRKSRLVESEEVCGWPMYALWCSTFEYELNVTGSPLIRSKITQPDNAVHLKRWEITRGGDVMSIRQLPLIPMWYGFFVNTVLYGCIWFGLLFSLTNAKHSIRKCRGLCPNCRYDLRHNLNTGCPECGWNRGECQ